jgi:hypothetical protein
MNVKFKASVPPSRLNKQQVIAFLTPEQTIGAYRYAQKNDLTNQEVIGHAINILLNSHSIDDWFSGGHSRIVRRSKGKSKTRIENAPLCRQEKRSFGGWFEKHLVEELRNISNKMGIPIQQIIEDGIQMLTNDLSDNKSS